MGTVAHGVWFEGSRTTSNINKEAAQEPEETPSLFTVLLRTGVALVLLTVGLRQHRTQELGQARAHVVGLR